MLNDDLIKGVILAGTTIGFSYLLYNTVNSPNTRKTNSLLQDHKNQKPSKQPQSKTSSNSQPSDVPTLFKPFLDDLSQFKQDHESTSGKSLHEEWFYVVGIDIGATNIRTCLKFIKKDKNSKDQSRVFKGHKLQCKCTSTLIALMEEISKQLEDVLGSSFHSSGGVLAVAGPVGASADKVTLTNYGGENNLRVDDLPNFMFPKNKTKFLNDLEACCFGIVGIGAKGQLGEYFDDAWTTEKVDSRDLRFENSHYAVLAVGTGLGTGLILSQTYKDVMNTDPSFEVLPLEAGHCLVTTPGKAVNDYENDLQRINYLSELLYDSEHPIEFEDIVSGRGLKACYEFETGKYDPTIKVEDIVNENSQQSKDAMFAHYKYLMKAAQNICVMIPSCKGVFFAGDNQVANDTFFGNNSSLFKEEFLNHPKRHWLDGTNALRQRRKLNLNIEGTFHYLEKYICKN